MSQPSLNDQLEAFLRARPYRWIDGKELAQHFGGYGWRSRISDVRRQRGLVIENRVRTVNDGYRVSEYRYLPDVGAQRTA